MWLEILAVQMSSNILPGELLAKGYFVPLGKEKKTYKLNLNG